MCGMQARNVPRKPSSPTGKNSTCSLMYALDYSIIYNAIADFKLFGMFMGILFGSS